MQSKTGNEAPLQPLPNDVQERVWAFVREQIRHHEDTTGAKVAKFEIHVTDAGQIEVEVLATQTEEAAALGDGLEDAQNRTDRREELHRGDAALKAE